MKTARTYWDYVRLPLLFAAAVVLLCWRAQYGYSFDDEPFLVSLAQRLYAGDSLFIDEWNLAQNVGVLLLPFYRIYIALFGSVDGILLTFRHVYCVLWAFTCTTVYAVLCKRHRCAIVAFAYLLLFSPLDQMLLSYTSFGLMGSVLIACLFYYHLNVRPLKGLPFAVVFSGLLIVTVIAIPYMAIAYAAALIAATVYWYVKRNKRSRWLMRVMLISAGICAGVLVLYAWRFLWNQYSVAEFFEKLPNMFMNSKRVGQAPDKLSQYLDRIVNQWPFYCATLFVTSALSLVPRIKQSFAWRTLLFGINAFVFLLELLYLQVACGQYQFNYQMIPLALLGLPTMLLLKAPTKHKRVLTVFYAFGVLLSVVFYASSDTGLKAIGMGFAISGVASILWIERFAKEWIADAAARCGKHLAWYKVVAILGVATLFVCQIALQVSLKIERQYFDSPLYNITTTVDRGAAKGLKTSDWHKSQYETRYDTIESLFAYVDMTRKDEIMFMTLLCDPIVYLDRELNVGAFSTWGYSKANSPDAFIAKTKLYYEMSPHRVPNVILFQAGDGEWFELIGIDTSKYVIFTEEDLCLMVRLDLVNTAMV